jgi:hypothetical protein
MTVGFASVSVASCSWPYRLSLPDGLTSQGGGVVGFGGWLGSRPHPRSACQEATTRVKGSVGFSGWLLCVGGPLDTCGWALPRPTEGEDTQGRTLLRFRAFLAALAGLSGAGAPSRWFWPTSVALARFIALSCFRCRVCRADGPSGEFVLVSWLRFSRGWASRPGGWASFRRLRVGTRKVYRWCVGALSGFSVISGKGV